MDTSFNSILTYFRQIIPLIQSLSNIFIQSKLFVALCILFHVMQGSFRKTHPLPLIVRNFNDFLTPALFIFTPSSSPISPAQPIPNQNDPHRPPHPCRRLHPRHRRRIPLLPPADQRNRRAGEK